MTNAQITIVARYRFGPMDRIQIDGRDYVRTSSNQLGHMLSPFGDEIGLTISISHAEIATRMSAGSLVVHRNWYDGRQARQRLKSTAAILSDLAPKEQLEVLRRLHFVTRQLQEEAVDPNVRRSDRSMVPTIAKLQIEHLQIEAARSGKPQRCGRKTEYVAPPSPRSLRRWLKDYEASGFNAMSLRPGHHRSGNRDPRIDTDSKAFAVEHAWNYASLNRPTKTMVHEQYADAILEENVERLKAGFAPLTAIGSRAFSLLICSLPEFAVYAGRHGDEAAKLKYAITNRGNGALRPLERVEADEHRISLQTLMVELGVWPRLSKKLKAEIERTRAWITVFVDCATRCILALRLLAAPPNSESARAGLEMATFDKERLADAVGTGVQWEMHGRIESLATDGGAGFVALETQAAIRDLGIAYDAPPGGLPALRGTIERLFYTVQKRFNTLFPGQTFENVVTRGNYDAEGNACLSLKELNALLIRHIVDIYHNSPHEGLAGETPRNAWIRLTNLYWIEAPPSEDVRRHIFGIRTKRRITGRGIRFLGLHYQSPELQQLRQYAKSRPVDIMVDRHDLGAISVRVGDDRMTVPAVFSEIAGTAIHEWVEAATVLRRHNAAMASLSKDTVRQALADIREHSEIARKRAEIGEPIISETAIHNVERDLFLSFAFAGEPPPADEDLLAADLQVFPKSQDPAPSSPAQSPNEFGGPEDWMQE